MAELIALFVLICSFLAMATIVVRKIPALTQLKEMPTSFGLKIKIQKLAGKIKFSRYLKIPSFEILSQKILSKIRILTLKIENKTENWLQKSREKTQKKKENDKYWQKLKKSIKEDKPGNSQKNSPR